MPIRLTLAVVVAVCVGCKHVEKPHITAVSLDPCNFGQESGIPFYLPKPLLIVSKNFRNIEEARVGLTDSSPIPTTFDDQAKYADVNARTNFQGLGDSAAATQSGAIGTGSTPSKSAPHVTTAGSAVTPGVVPSDGLAPDTFFTYQIVFVPDLTQKYGLKIRGGAGEIRAAMNLVNGWQFTGLGPYYMKDSSTSQNILSGGIATRLGGQAVADVLSEVNDLAGTLGAGGTQSGTIGAGHPQVQALARSIEALPQGCDVVPLVDFAEIYVYEASLGPEGRMQWLPIAQHTFNRDFIGVQSSDLASGGLTQSGDIAGSPGRAPHTGQVADNPVYQQYLAKALGVPAEAIGPGGETQAGALGTLQTGNLPAIPAAGINQVQVDCGNQECPPSHKEFNLFRIGRRRQNRGKVQSKVVRAVRESFLSGPEVADGGPIVSAGGNAASPTPEPEPEPLPDGGGDPLFDGDGAFMERLPQPVATVTRHFPAP